MVILTSDNGGFAGATNNSPLRANKGSNYEGGLRVPAIIKWPESRKGGIISSVPITSTDFYPTILAAIGQPLRPYQHQDGVDLTPLLKGAGTVNRDSLFWHYPHYNNHPQSFPAGVIRSGDWKLIQAFETGELSLFNLKEDCGETTNLAKKKPNRAKLLLSKLKMWQQEVGRIRCEQILSINPKNNETIISFIFEFCFDYASQSGID